MVQVDFTELMTICKLYMSLEVTNGSSVIPPYAQHSVIWAFAAVQRQRQSNSILSTPPAVFKQAVKIGCRLWGKIRRKYIPWDVVRLWGKKKILFFRIVCYTYPPTHTHTYTVYVPIYIYIHGVCVCMCVRAYNWYRKWKNSSLDAK
jgi:hypothetical protein